MSCGGKNCNMKKEAENFQSVERYSFEVAMAMAERTIRRLWITTILLIVLLVASNAAWLYYNSQFEDVETRTTEITQENSDGYNNYIGNDGDIINNPSKE